MKALDRKMSRQLSFSFAFPSNALPSRTMMVRFQRTCGAASWRTAKCTLKVLLSLISFYFFVAWPPLHWFYEVASPAGPSSVYVPGGGFSGFWFHLGYLQSMENSLQDYDYYCYSSGCLGILAAFMNHTVDDVMDAAISSQENWLKHDMSRFDLVPDFFDRVVPPYQENNPQFQRILPKLKVLVTTKSNGLEILEASSRDELLDLMIKTTWVPVLTGRGILVDEKDLYLDGGFSRLLHPECAYRLDLPLIWETLVHTFTPSLTRDTVQELWNAGYGYEDYRFPRRNRDYSIGDLDLL